MKRLAKQHGRFTILRASQHQFASCSRVMFVVRDGTTLESNRHLKCSSPCGLWCLCPTQESNQEEFRKPFPDSDKEFELDFKLKSPVFTKKRVWRHLILAQTAGSRTNAETQICPWSGFRKHGAYVLEHRRHSISLDQKSYVNSMRWQSLCIWDAQEDSASEDMENITKNIQNCWENAHMSGRLSRNPLQTAVISIRTLHKGLSWVRIPLEYQEASCSEIRSFTNAI